MYSLTAVLNASRPVGRYTPLILSSYTSYRLNSSSSFTSFTAPFLAHYVFSWLRERQTSDPSIAT